MSDGDRREGVSGLGQSSPTTVQDLRHVWSAHHRQYWHQEQDRMAGLRSRRRRWLSNLGGRAEKQEGGAELQNCRIGEQRIEGNNASKATSITRGMGGMSLRRKKAIPAIGLVHLDGRPARPHPAL